MVNMKKQLILDQEMLSNSNMKVEELESRLINYESTYTIEREDLVADVKLYESKIASFENERLKQMDKFNKLQQAFAKVQLEKDQSEILHKDNIHTYTDELDHLKEELEMLTSKKVELAKVIEQNKVEYVSLNEMKENLTKDLKAALMQISDLE